MGWELGWWVVLRGRGNTANIQASCACKESRSFCSIGGVERSFPVQTFRPVEKVGGGQARQPPQDAGLQSSVHLHLRPCLLWARYAAGVGAAGGRWAAEQECQVGEGAAPLAFTGACCSNS